MNRQRHGYSSAIVVTIAAFLSGCSVLQATNPLQQPEVSTLPEVCVQSIGNVDRVVWMRAAAATFEQQGFTLRDTETRLGLISAERVSSMPGLGAINSAWRGSWYGNYNRRHFAEGLADPWWVFRSDPVRTERVSIVADGHRLIVTRGETVTESDGFDIQARAAATVPFCQAVFTALRSRLDSSVSRRERP
ncbi:hypothetical protein [Phytohalomonas tamaricis]|uniref:hypothetical protein n=1 Tax=Phytohalomonas tamaricis TaxID=2081032 RepID=UPI001319D7C0|nr:hypothetical protein [Phytohalomonas tamaricis]